MRGWGGEGKCDVKGQAERREDGGRRGKGDEEGQAERGGMERRGRGG